MLKLSFDYDSRTGESIAEAPGGYVVRAVRDESPENPWHAWDGQPPCLVAYDRSLEELGTIPDVLGGLSDSWIKRHWRELCRVFDAPESEARQSTRDYGGTAAEWRREWLERWLCEVKPSRYGGSTREYMEALEAICTARGWPVLDTCSQGYSQGDYADLLLIFSPAYAKEIGRAWPKSAKARAACVESLRADAKLWSAWAWGEVYGFVIERDGEHVDSCFGFYGADFDESGLAEAAAESLEHLLDAARKARLAKVKELIRARVPLHVRAAVLESMQ